MKKTEGFTLFELLVTIAIIGVLAAIAIPNYTAYKQKGVLGGVKSFMVTVASKQQEYMLTNRQYALDDVVGDNQGLAKLNTSLEQDIATHFNVKITDFNDKVADPSEFVITLTPKANGLMDGYEVIKADGTTLKLGDTAPEVPLTLNSVGQKSPPELW